VCAQSDFVMSATGLRRVIREEGAAMTNLLERAIDTDCGNSAAKLIQNALGIETNDVANYCFPKTWPQDREQRARIIGDWLRAEVRYLA
jgi:hypothetical protein